MTPDGIVGSLVWRGERLDLRPAQLSDVPAIVRLHRALVGVAPERPDLEAATAWFTVGGPWMHEFYCERHLRGYNDVGGDVWLVSTAAGELVGNVELWYDQEPEPFGRYAHIELLDLLPDYLEDEVEEWLIDRAERRARERGYGRFWCRPVGSGGSPHLLNRRGYRRRWENGQVTLRQLEKIQPPAHSLRPLLGDYASEAAPLLSLNHREAAGYRWRYLWRLVLDPEAADMPRDTTVWAAEVRFPSPGGGLLLLSLWNWYADPTEARVDLWVKPELQSDHGNTAELLAVAARQAQNMGARSLISYLPKSLAQAVRLTNLECQALDDDDPWLMKEL